MQTAMSPAACTHPKIAMQKTGTCLPRASLLSSLRVSRCGNLAKARASHEQGWVPTPATYLPCHNNHFYFYATTDSTTKKNIAAMTLVVVVDIGSSQCRDDDYLGEEDDQALLPPLS